MKGNHKMNIPGLTSLKSIGATNEDLKEEVNQLQFEKRQLRLKMNNKQVQINLRIAEIDKRKQKEENNK
tara:strand:+ start:403 stop:609 length:207 start_codon:yes stop_codon:yes gene_type:complete